MQWSPSPSLLGDVKPNDSFLYYGRNSYNGSFEKNGRRAFYLPHHTNPPRAEANPNGRMSAPR